MYVACRNGWLVQFPSEFHNPPIDTPDILVIGKDSLFYHKFIVGRGLYLKVIVKRSDFCQLLFVSAREHRLIKFARFAGRSDNKAFPMRVDHAFWHTWLAVKIVKMCKGYQLIEILQPPLIFA